MAGILDGFTSTVGGWFDNSTQPIDTSTFNRFNYNNLLNEYNSLGAQLSDGMARGLDVTDINNQMDNISTQLTNLEQLATLQNMDPSKMTPLQAMQAQQMLDANTGFTGWANNTFGGMGNFVNTLGQLGKLYMNARALGIAEDQLDLQTNAFNFDKAVTSTNLANQAKLTNARTKDILQARAHAEKGDRNAYNDEIKRREVKSEI